MFTVESSFISFRFIIIQFFASNKKTGNVFEVKCSYDEIKGKDDLSI